jgi:hypothetical protein
MKPITWSGGDVEMMPVIGFAETHPIDLGPMGYVPGSREAVVEIADDGEIYILNSWYKPGVPRILHKNLVATWEPTKNC